MSQGGGVCHRALNIDSFHCPDISRDNKNILWLIPCPNLRLNLHLFDDQNLPNISTIWCSHQKICNTAKVIAFQFSAANIKQLCVTTAWCHHHWRGAIFAWKFRQPWRLTVIISSLLMNKNLRSIVYSKLPELIGSTIILVKEQIADFLIASIGIHVQFAGTNFESLIWAEWVHSDES